MLYGKVDFIVTDSPILLAGIYQEYRSEGRDKYVGNAAKAFMNHARECGVEYINFVLERSKPFDPRGRWETEEQAKDVDVFVRNYLFDTEGQMFTTVYGPNEKRDEEILSILQKNNKIGSGWR
jgi:hypothetical protein